MIPDPAELRRARTAWISSEVDASTARLAEPNRIRETAGIELTSGRGEAIGIGGEPGRGPAGDELRPRCSPAGGLLSAALLGRAGRRLPAAAASWVGMGSLVAASLLASSCSCLGLGSLSLFFSFFFFFGFLPRWFFPGR